MSAQNIAQNAGAVQKATSSQNSTSGQKATSAQNVTPAEKQTSASDSGKKSKNPGGLSQNSTSLPLRTEVKQEELKDLFEKLEKNGPKVLTELGIHPDAILVYPESKVEETAVPVQSEKLAASAERRTTPVLDKRSTPVLDRRSTPVQKAQTEKPLLHLALEHHQMTGNITAFKNLLAAKADVTKKDKRGMNSLFVAISLANFEAVQLLLESDPITFEKMANTLYKDSDKQSDKHQFIVRNALDFAATRRIRDIPHLTTGPDRKEISDEEKEKRLCAIVSVLAQIPELANKGNSKALKPLAGAIERGLVERAFTLIPKTNFTQDLTNYILIAAKASFFHAKVEKLIPILVKAMTHDATQKEHALQNEEVVQPGINTVDIDHRTPLMCIFQELNKHNFLMVRALIEHGADLSFLKGEDQLKSNSEYFNAMKIQNLFGVLPLLLQKGSNLKLLQEINKRMFKGEVDQQKKNALFLEVYPHILEFFATNRLTPLVDKIKKAYLQVNSNDPLMKNREVVEATIREVLGREGKSLFEGFHAQIESAAKRNNSHEDINKTKEMISEILIEALFQHLNICFLFPQSHPDDKLHLEKPELELTRRLKALETQCALACSPASQNAQLATRKGSKQEGPKQEGSKLQGSKQPVSNGETKDNAANQTTANVHDVHGEGILYALRMITVSHGCQNAGQQLSNLKALLKDADKGPEFDKDPDEVQDDEVQGGAHLKVETKQETNGSQTSKTPKSPNVQSPTTPGSTKEAQSPTTPGTGSTKGQTLGLPPAHPKSAEDDMPHKPSHSPRVQRRSLHLRRHSSNSSESNA